MGFDSYDTNLLCDTISCSCYFFYVCYLLHSVVTAMLCCSWCNQAAGGPLCVEDPQLKRVVAVWKATQVEAVEKQLLMYGPDRVDLLLRKVGL